jgi:hypothetical protein
MSSFESTTCKSKKNLSEIKLLFWIIDIEKEVKITYGAIYYTWSVTSSCDIVYIEALCFDLFLEIDREGKLRTRILNIVVILIFPL